jgi:hypothetical protein
MTQYNDNQEMLASLSQLRLDVQRLSAQAPLQAWPRELGQSIERAGAHYSHMHKEVVEDLKEALLWAAVVFGVAFALVFTTLVVCIGGLL